MAVDHKIFRHTEKFRGLDKRSSDIQRNREYATDMKNAAIRLSGDINKRKGFKTKISSDEAYSKGIVTFNDKNMSNGAVEEKLIIAEDRRLNKLQEYNFSVRYKHPVHVAEHSVYVDTESETFKYNIYNTKTDAYIYGPRDLGSGKDPDDVTVETLVNEINKVREPVLKIHSATDYGDQMFLNVAEYIKPHPTDPNLTWRDYLMSLIKKAVLRNKEVNFSVIPAQYLRGYDPNNIDENGDPIFPSEALDPYVYFPRSVLAYPLLYDTFLTQEEISDMLIAPDDNISVISSNENTSSFAYMPGFFLQPLDENFQHRYFRIPIDSKGNPILLREGPNILFNNNIVSPGYSITTDLTNITFNNFYRPIASYTGTGQAKAALLDNFVDVDIDNTHTTTTYEWERLPAPILDKDKASFNSSIGASTEEARRYRNHYFSSNTPMDEDFENVSFAEINNVLYVSSGNEDMIKYDGEFVYRPGLPQFKKEWIDSVKDAVDESYFYSSDQNINLEHTENIGSNAFKYNYVFRFSYEDAKGNLITGEPSEPIEVFSKYSSFRANEYTMEVANNNGSGQVSLPIAARVAANTSSNLGTIEDVTYSTYLYESNSAFFANFQEGVDGRIPISTTTITGSNVYEVINNIGYLKIPEDSILDRTLQEGMYVQFSDGNNVYDNNGNGYKIQRKYPYQRYVFYNDPTAYIYFKDTKYVVIKFDTDIESGNHGVSSVATGLAVSTLDTSSLTNQESFDTNIKDRAPEHRIEFDKSAIIGMLGFNGNSLGWNVESEFPSNHVQERKGENGEKVDLTPVGKKIQIEIFRTKMYNPGGNALEVAGQYYYVGSIGYDGNVYSTNSDNFMFLDSKADEVGKKSFALVNETGSFDFIGVTVTLGLDANQADQALNPFLIFTENIKRHDPPPKGRYLTVFKNVLVVAGQQNNVNNLQYSLGTNVATGEIGSEYFPDDDNGVIVQSAFGDRITAIATLRDLLYIFHNNSIHVLGGNLAEPSGIPFAIDLLTKEGGVGCTSASSIVEYQNKLLFLSERGIYAIDSTNALQELSSIVRPYFTDVSLSKQRCVSYNWVEKNLLIFSIPREDIVNTYYRYTSSSLVLVYDYFNDAWLEWDNIDLCGGVSDFKSNVFYANRIAGTTAVNSDLNLFSNNGNTYDYNDHNEAIKFSYETNWESLNNPTVFKKFLRIKLFSFDTAKDFETVRGFELLAKMQVNYKDSDVGEILFNFKEFTQNGWGYFEWGNATWGNILSSSLKHKLLRNKAKCLKIEFINEKVNENVLLTSYEFEMATPFREEIKE